MGGTTEKGETKFLKFSGGKQKRTEHDFWLKFSEAENLGGNYEYNCIGGK